MKSKFLTVLLLIASISLSAQVPKGSFMAEGGIKLGNNWRYESMLFPDGFGISVGTRDVYNKNYSTGNDQFSWGTRNFGFSLSPRFGYSVFRNFLVGIDLKYIRNNYSYSPFKDEDKGYDRGKGYGFFIRKYFGAKKFTPFIEGEFGFWSLKNFGHSSSPGGGLYESTGKHDLAYYGGAFGYSYSVGSRFKLNLMAKLQHTEVTSPNYSYYKELDFDSALVLSFSYFLNRKEKL